MDFISLQGATLAMLGAIGASNVFVMFWPTSDSRVKWAVSFVAALLLGLVPEAVSGEIAGRIVDAVTVAFSASGVYKISQNLGAIPKR